MKALGETAHEGRKTDLQVGKRPIKVGKRPIKKGKRPIEANGLFSGAPPWWKENGPSQNAH